MVKYSILMDYSYIIVLSLFIFWGVLIYIFFRKRDLLKKYSLDISLFFLLWKTEKGKKLIEKLSKKDKFWNIYADISIIIVVVAMIFMTLLLIWNATIIQLIPPDKIKPEMVLGLPGINPFIPVTYGILSLAVAIIVHEFAHGILTRIAKVKILSLGLIFFIVPMGAFVEPDENELFKVQKKKRARMFAVGPATNLIVAIICALIFSFSFMSSVVPKEDGAIVVGVVKESPAYNSEISAWMQITEINGKEIKSANDFYNVNESGENVNLTIFYKGEFMNKIVNNSFVISSILIDSPAHTSNIKVGTVLIAVNETNITSYNQFIENMNKTKNGQNITLKIKYDSKVENRSVILGDKYDFYSKYYPSENKESYRGKGFLGVGLSYLGVDIRDARTLPEKLASPYKDVKDVNSFINASFHYIGQPIFRMSPLESPITDLYKIEGFWSFLPEGAFWFLANSFYWLFWLNLMVGLTNSLPAIPLDGGYIFKDGLRAFIDKTAKKWNEEKKEKVLKYICYSVALFILALIIWQLIGPAIFRYL